MMRRKLLVEALHDPGPDYSSHTNAKSDLAMEKLVVNLFSRPRLAASAAKSRFMAFVKSSLPLADQMATYDWKLFGEDLIAAVTVAFVLLPQSIAYAGLAQVDPIQALLSAIFPPVLYVFFGSSRQLSIGPEAMVSVVAGSAIIDYMENNPGTAYTAPQIASALALVVGLMCILLSIMRAGFIDNILSGYLLTGFILGGASLIMVEQLPELLGIDVDLEAQESTINMLIATYHHLGNVKWAVAAISLVNVAFLLGFNHLKHKFGKKIVWLGRAPEILILVVLMIGLSAGLDFHGKGIAVLGTFDNKIKMPSPPPLKFELLKKLIEPAMTITLNGFIECQTVTRDFGLKNGYFPSGDQELFAFGFINFVSAFLGAYPTFGSLPRSRILAQSGARTTLSNAMAGVFVLVALLTMVPVLQHLPRSTLASIVFVAALGLIDTKEIAFVFRLRAWSEIAMFLATYVITLVTSITTGILICLTLSALLIVRRTTTASMSVMGRVQYQTPDQHHEPTRHKCNHPHHFVHHQQPSQSQFRSGTPPPTPPYTAPSILDDPSRIFPRPPAPSWKDPFTGWGSSSNSNYSRPGSAMELMPASRSSTPIFIAPTDTSGHNQSVDISALQSTSQNYLSRSRAGSLGSTWGAPTPQPPDVIARESPTPRLPSRKNSSSEKGPISYVNVDEHPSAELLDGVILLRIEVPLLFYNAGQARRAIDALMQAELRLARERDRRRRVRQRRRLRGAAGRADGSGAYGAVGTGGGRDSLEMSIVTTSEVEAAGAAAAAAAKAGVGAGRRRAGRSDRGRGWRRMEDEETGGERGFAEAIAISLGEASAAAAAGKTDADTSAVGSTASADGAAATGAAVVPALLKKPAKKRGPWKKRRGSGGGRGGRGGGGGGLGGVGGIGGAGGGVSGDLRMADDDLSLDDFASDVSSTGSRHSGDGSDGEGGYGGRRRRRRRRRGDGGGDAGGAGDGGGAPDSRGLSSGSESGLSGSGSGSEESSSSSSSSSSSRGLHTIVLDFKRCTDMDSAATFVLRKIFRTFNRQGMRVCLVGLHEFQISLFQRAGMSAILDGSMFDTMAAAVDDIEEKLAQRRDGDDGGVHAGVGGAQLQLSAMGFDDDF